MMEKQGVVGEVVHLAAKCLLVPRVTHRTREATTRVYLLKTEGGRCPSQCELVELRPLKRFWLVRRQLLCPVVEVTNHQGQEKQPFASWAAVEAIADEIDPRYAPLVIFAAATGLRPGEWAALEWADIDLKAQLTPTVNVERRLTKDGDIAPPKNGKSRQVPLQPRAIAALKSIQRRLDIRLVFPAPRGGHIDLHNWRERHWHPAMVSAGFVTDDGKPDRGPYALRHTYATTALRAGWPTFTVARRMGTSLQMIDKHYGHLAQDAAEHELALLERYENETVGPRVAPAESAQ